MEKELWLSRSHSARAYEDTAEGAGDLKIPFLDLEQKEEEIIWNKEVN